MCIFRLATYATTGGMKMNANDFWAVFLETGAPEFYLMYANARKVEERNVPDDPGFGAASHGLQ